MVASLLNFWRIRELRTKLAFTAAILLIYRFGAFIPAPGIDKNALNDFGSGGGGSILNFLNLFSGGALERFSIFALGILPYITASIIFQLLTVAVPSLEKLSKEGESGTKKINQYTRYATVALAAGQAVGYYFIFRGQLNTTDQTAVSGFSDFFLIVLSLTAGTTLVMWMGELITQRGIGNGISLIIFASIVTRFPGAVSGWYGLAPVPKVIIPVIALAVIAAIVFIQEGQRRVPIQYAKRIIGRRSAEGGSTYLPLRVNMAGVIPVIFAASVMAFPPTIARFLDPSQRGTATTVADALSPQGTYGGAFYVAGESIFIILFTYFYTAVIFNPVDQADNLKKNGGFIPGVRPGRPTAEFLDRILTRLTLPGALYLAAVAALPTLLIQQLNTPFFLGGTSLLIVVGVALDTVRQLESQLQERRYEGLIRT